MLRSMTAFARCEAQHDWGTLSWELRAVNHRYLDVSVRLPEEARSLEQEIRKRIGAYAKRGKLECSLRLNAHGGEQTEVNLDKGLVKQLAHASREVDQLLYNAAPVNSMDVLRWPGVLQIAPPSVELVGPAILELLDQALEELIATRKREGARIRDFLLARLAEVDPHLTSVRGALPEIIDSLKQRFLARMAELKGELEPQRLEQELVIHAQKLDVAEELDRLEVHVQEVRRVLDDKEPVGRRLDFLMQELNREANTLSSKSASSDTTLSAVDLKVIIEQMREQIQNVE